ncbi:hypothetical protein RRG08_053984, partial [Elysia crispata]
QSVQRSLDASRVTEPSKTRFTRTGGQQIALTLRAGQGGRRSTQADPILV